MATFRKRDDKWIAEVCVNGMRKSKTHPNKTSARLWASQAEVELGKMVSVNTVMTLSDVFKRYAEEVSDAKKGARWELVRLKKFDTFPLSKIKLVDLKRKHFDNFIDDRLKSVKPSSVNRELNLISHCLTQARRWCLMSSNPMEDLKRPKNPPHRDRRIGNDEIERLKVALCYDAEFPAEAVRQRIAVAFLFAIETGMRAGEICGIKPDHVNIDQSTVFLPDTKNGLPRYVPLSAEAINLLDQVKPWGDSVFSLKSGSISTIFLKACRLADIDDLTFHDTRHEAITRLAEKLDVLDLARMVGHRNIKQLMTYYNKSASDIANTHRHAMLYRRR